MGILRAVVTANTGPFERGMGRAQTALLGLTRAFLPLGGGLAGGALIASSIRGLEMFDRAMNRSTAIMGDLSDGMRNQLKQAAIEVAKTTVFSGEQAAQAFFFLASAGLNAQQSLAALPAVAKFAQAGMFDLALATDLLTDAQSALGLTVKDARKNLENMIKVSDVLVKANTLANASVQQFSEALTTKAGAALKILNKDIEEGVAVLAAFADQGVKGAEAGTALNIILRDLSTKALQNAAAFERFGVAVFDSSGNMRNIGMVIRDIENAISGMSDAQAKATLLQLGFADKSIIFIQTLLGLSDKIEEYERELRKAAGTTEEVADKQMTDMEKAVARLSGAWLEFTDTLRTGSLPTVIQLAASVVEWAKRMDILTGIVESAMVVWSFFGVLIQGVVTGAVKAFGFLTRAVIALFDAIGGGVAESTREFADAIDTFAERSEYRLIKNQDEMIRRWEMLGTIQEDAARKTDDVGKSIQETAEKMAEALDGIQDTGDAMDEAAEDAQKLVDSLQEQVDTWGMAAHEVQVYRFGIENLTDAQREQIEALQETLDLLEREADMLREAKRIIEATRTPTEKYADEVERLKELLEKEFIDQNTFDRAVKQAEDRMRRAQEALTPRELQATDQRAGEFREVRLSRIAMGGIGGRDKAHEQRDMVIEWLQSIREKLNEPEPVPLIMN